MRTNFNHLREYPKYFEIAKTAEKQFLKFCVQLKGE